MSIATLHRADCLDVMRTMPDKSADLIYLDPPFFTRKVHSQSSRKGRQFSFDDLWRSRSAYADFIGQRLIEMHRLLSPRGSIVFHCDRNATHIARLLLDEIFGEQCFRAEIIWHYRRWSNTRKGLLPAHQTLLWYSRSDDYVFNPILRPYSPTTNVDQILQLRARDARDKAVYKRDTAGDVIYAAEKKGVPLSDVWDIPFLNPKARERVGYPTQKPLALLDRVVEVFSDEGGCVLDPFCGSGTTLIAATSYGRGAIGIDVSAEAIELTRNRLSNPIRSHSRVLSRGRDAFDTAEHALLAMLQGVDVIPVHRNRAIDGFLRQGFCGAPVPLRIQREDEPLPEAAERLWRAAQRKAARVCILVTTAGDTDASVPEREGLIVVDSPARAIRTALAALSGETSVHQLANA